MSKSVIIGYDTPSETARVWVFNDGLRNLRRHKIQSTECGNIFEFLGVNLNAAGQLAGIIKAKEQEIDLSARIEPVAKTILTHKFAKPDMLEMMPGRRKPVTITTNNNGRARMNFKAGKFAHTGINMGQPAAARTLAQLGLAAGGGGGLANIAVGNGINYS